MATLLATRWPWRPTELAASVVGPRAADTGASGVLPEPPGELYIGLMSGTSLDAVDGVLASFDNGRVHVHGHTAIDLPDTLRSELLALNTAGHNELHRAAMAANELVDIYADVVHALMAPLASQQRQLVRAIGAHGQTVRHQPHAGYTVQLNAPARLAEATSVSVIADFRSRDVAAGGQGAPLVPAFHEAVFAGNQPRVILNLGGIANISVLGASARASAGANSEAPGVVGACDSPRASESFEASGVFEASTVSKTSEPNAHGSAKNVFGFDTGPANMLLDLWCHRHTGQPYDVDGGFAAAGHVHAELLHYLINSEPWLGLPPPKSTGRDLFNAKWLDIRLQQYQSLSISHPLSPADIQATLTAFSAETAAQAIKQYASTAREVYVCGGGAANPELMRQLATRLPHCQLGSTATLGVPPQQVEALAFAWLAYAYICSMPANVPAVTGARGPRVLGAYYPA